MLKQAKYHKETEDQKEAECQSNESKEQRIPESNRITLECNINQKVIELQH